MLGGTQVLQSFPEDVIRLIAREAAMQVIMSKHTPYLRTNGGSIVRQGIPRNQLDPLLFANHTFFAETSAVLWSDVRSWQNPTYNRFVRQLDSVIALIKFHLSGETLRVIPDDDEVEVLESNPILKQSSSNKPKLQRKKPNTRDIFERRCHYLRSIRCIEGSAFLKIVKALGDELVGKLMRHLREISDCTSDVCDILSQIHKTHQPVWGRGISMVSASTLFYSRDMDRALNGLMPFTYLRQVEFSFAAHSSLKSLQRLPPGVTSLMVSILENLGNIGRLEKFSLSSPHISRDVLVALEHVGGSLKELSLIGSSIDVWPTQTHLSHLNSLTLNGDPTESGSDSDDGGVLGHSIIPLFLQKRCKWKALSLDRAFVTNAVLRVLNEQSKDFSELESLGIGCHERSSHEPGLRKFDGFISRLDGSKLQSLRLRYMKTGPSIGVPEIYLRHCTELRELHLDSLQENILYRPVYWENPNRNASSLFELLEINPHLESLCVLGHSVTADDVTTILDELMKFNYELFPRLMSLVIDDDILSCLSKSRHDFLKSFDHIRANVSFVRGIHYRRNFV